MSTNRHQLDNKLKSCKHVLFERLEKDAQKRYLSLLRSWFRHKVDRVEFEKQARCIIPGEAISLHNHFLLAILAKCNSLVNGNESVGDVSSPRPKQHCPPANHAYTPHFDPYSFAPLTILKESNEQLAVEYAHTQHEMPGIAQAHARILAIAWDHGLESVDEGLVSCLVLSVKVLLQRILIKVVARDTKRKRGPSCDPLSPVDRLAFGSPSDSDEQLGELNQFRQYSHSPPLPQTITALDLSLALLRSPKLIPSATVRALANERILDFTSQTDPS